MRAVVIPADLSQPIRVEEISFSEIRTIVGGYIQALGVPELEGSLYMDEESRFKKSVAPNPRATAITASFLNMSSVILGDVVLVGAADDEGNETDVPDQIVQVLEKVFSQGRI